MTVIKNCVLVGGRDAEVISEFDETATPYMHQGELHSGTDIKATNVYSVCPGTVMIANKYENHYIVVVQYNLGSCMMYHHLKSITVKVNDQIQLSDKIGVADRWVHVCYLTQQSSIWPVRVLDRTYYKHNPAEILSTGYGAMINYFENIRTSATITYIDASTIVTESSLNMLSNNRGK